MFLIEPEPTPYDLNFRLFGIAVRVHPWFWIMNAIMGWPALNRGVAYLLLWIVCVFFSILVHEMGHILMGLLFGARGHIILYSFGGLAVGSSALSNRWKRIAVYLAGPGAGFLVYGLVVLAELTLTGEEAIHPLLQQAVRNLVGINLFWGLLNLVPIWPLDGGQISRDFLDWLLPRNGVRVAFGISLLLAGLLAIHSLLAEYGNPLIPFLPIGGMYSAIFFALLAIGSYQAMQMEPRRRSPWDREDEPLEPSRQPWEREEDSWRR